MGSFSEPPAEAGVGTEDETPTAEDEAPAAEDEAPAAEDETPAADAEMLAAIVLTPAVDWEKAAAWLARAGLTPLGAVGGFFSSPNKGLLGTDPKGVVRKEVSVRWEVET